MSNAEPVIPLVNGLPVSDANPLPTTGGGGGGGAVTIADGADVAEGSTTDDPVTDPSEPGTTIGLLKGLLDSAVTLGQATMANSVPVVIASNQSDVPVSISGTVPVSDGTLTVKGYQQITDVSSATGLTVPSGATQAIITVEAAAVRWRDDGSDPTDDVGMPLVSGQTFQYNGDLAAIKFIDQTSGAILNVSYYA